MVRKIAAASGLAKIVRSECSKIRPVNAAGMVATIKSKPRRGVRRRDAPLPCAARESADDLGPIVAEVDEQRDRGADMQRDEEREVRRLRRLRLHEIVPTEERGDQHRVTQTRHREQFGHALKKAYDYCAKVREHRTTLARRRLSQSLRRTPSM